MIVNNRSRVLFESFMDASASTEEEIRAIERERTRALIERDMVVLERLHAPEYELITPAGKTFTRERYLGFIAAQPFYTKWDAKGSMNLRLSNEMAIVRYRVRLEFPSGRIVNCWHIDSYKKRAGQWQAVWSQATEIPAPESNTSLQN